RPAEKSEGFEFLRFVYPQDRDRYLALYRNLIAGRIESDQLSHEGRIRRRDQTVLWCLHQTSVVRDARGRAETFIGIIEDITDRKQQAERAAALQREMLPRAAPRLDDYELAASFLPAQDVAGDLYDWVETADGQLELTVADVMGKGMGSALVMAALRTALRTAPGELGPSVRLARVAESMTFGAENVELYVTVFNGRIELAPGHITSV